MENNANPPERIEKPAQIARDWLPIESAPKDDSVILLYGDEWTTLGWWDPADGIWIDERIPEYASTDRWQPTHWQPLPPPPGSEG